MRLVIRGYTIAEILVGLIAATLMGMAVIPLVQQNQRLIKAQALANETLRYSKIYVRYLLNNDAALREELKTNPAQVVPWSEVHAAQDYESGVAAQNKLGQTPCLVIIKSKPNQQDTSESQSQLRPFLFFLDKPSQTRRARVDIASVSNQMGAMAGVYLNNSRRHGVFGNHGGWSLPASSPAFIQIYSEISKCDGVLTDDSLVVNIAMLPDYTGLLAVANGESGSSGGSEEILYRGNDSNGDLDNDANRNTLQTDISLGGAKYGESSQRVYFNGNDESGVYLQRNADDAISEANRLAAVELHNANFAAPVLQATENSAELTRCDPREQGKIVRQLSGTQTLISGQMQCSYNPLICQGNAPNGALLNGYCYIPINEMSITYHPNSTKVICPYGYFIDMSVPPVIEQPPQMQASGNNCKDSASTWHYNQQSDLWSCSPKAASTQGCDCKFKQDDTRTLLYKLNGIKKYNKAQIGAGLDSGYFTWVSEGENSRCICLVTEAGTKHQVLLFMTSYQLLIKEYTCTNTTPIIDMLN